MNQKIKFRCYKSKNWNEFRREHQEFSLCASNYFCNQEIRITWQINDWCKYTSRETEDWISMCKLKTSISFGFKWLKLQKICKRKKLSYFTCHNNDWSKSSSLMYHTWDRRLHNHCISNGTNFHADEFLNVHVKVKKQLAQLSALGAGRVQNSKLQLVRLSALSAGQDLCHSMIPSRLYIVLDTIIVFGLFVQEVGLFDVGAGEGLVLL